jgi:shikimate dehydrogenase
VTDRDPVDRTGGPYALGVIGDPVAHSLSPAFQQPALDELGIPATYERWHTLSVDLPARVANLRHPTVLGANVTVPHKEAVLRMVDELTPAARRAGAVNTIVNRDGWLLGDNTDIHGFGASLTEALAGETPHVAVVLGAGGAARAVVLALESLAVEDIVVLNRDVERAMRLRNDLEPAPVRAAALDAETLARELPRADVLVNATSLGWRAGELPIDADQLKLVPKDALVADLTYRDTDLLAAAKERGLRTQDGLPMLVYQGARAFELFTGYPAPLATMLAAALRARDGATT